MSLNVNQGQDPAPLAKRVFAYCVDLGMISACLYVLFLAMGIVFGVFGVAVLPALKEMGRNGQMLSWILIAVLIAAVLALTLGAFHGYFIYFELKRGATPGKKIFGLRVISTRPPGESGQAQLTL